MTTPTEETSLLPTQQQLRRQSSVERGLSAAQGSASFHETVLNLMKTCAGTGTLALPFAAQKGGLLLNTFGLLLIASWNLYSVERLVKCLHYLRIKSHDEPPHGTSTFAKVAWFAFGNHGVHALDAVLVILFCGVIVAYEDAMIGFLSDTPLTSGSISFDAFVVALVIGILSLVPDYGYLSKASAFGLGTLALTFVVIAYFGHVPISTTGLNLWPQEGLTGVSHWFGCVVFGFGVVPLTYNFYESMHAPQQLVSATRLALLFTALSYITMGSGLLLLYPVVQGDILEQLPSGVVPTIVRLAMVVVVILTCPLLVLPCGLILEGKVQLLFGLEDVKGLRAIVRLSLCIVCTIFSIAIPNFVNVLSFVGCFSVAMVGFVIPPLLHITLTRRWNNNSSDECCTGWTLGLDIVMLTWGVTATIISSTYTFEKLYMGEAN